MSAVWRCFCNIRIKTGARITRVQLVVMAAVLAMVCPGKGCSIDCRPILTTISVKGCGITELVNTTECTGHCFMTDHSYQGNRQQQKTCNGDWTYMFKRIDGCPEEVPYPVAMKCNCAVCDLKTMDCGRFVETIPTCDPLLKE
ncbi:gonadotropin subunit beta-1 isoform X2 [Cynoglossus semilaevis]|uniref:gonadotropin subunit beta-1 isoform X2 n=1 Tax=Cynoglossus semilaevis TaxID=244447 RepID=UPI000D625354|nr:gonadotropin subunit beta-1 isoform X2 [Cynoglossus semilaevis]